MFNSFKVISWNILNQTYQDKYHLEGNKEISAVFPSGKQRDDQVIIQIDLFMKEKLPSVITLQEVSSNILVALKSNADVNGYVMFASKNGPLDVYKGKKLDSYGNESSQNLNVTFFHSSLVANGNLIFDNIDVFTGKDTYTSQFFYLKNFDLAIVNVHLPPLRFVEKPLKKILEHIIQRVSNLTRFMIVGDMNDEGQDLISLWREMHPLTMYTDIMFGTGKATRIGREKKNLILESIDHVIGRNVRLLLSNSATFDVPRYLSYEEEMTMYLSDHLPIEWYFSFL